MTTLENYRIGYKGYIDKFNDKLRLISPITGGLKGACIGTLNKYLGEDNRKQFLKALTGHSSSRELDEAEWYALTEWLGIQKIGGEWMIDNVDELKQVIALNMPDQEKLL